MIPHIQKTDTFSSEPSHSPKGSGVEKKDPPSLVLGREIGMAVDDTLNACKLSLDPFFYSLRSSPSVDEPNPKFSRSNHSFFGKLLANRGSIHIATNGKDFFLPENIHYKMSL